MKITFLGKDVEQPRRLDGKYKGRAVRGVKLAFWVTLLGGLVFVAGQPLLNNWYAGQEMVAHADADPTALAQEMYGKSIDSLKSEVVQALEVCESQGVEGLIVFDQNKEGTLKGKHIASIGVLQFKVSTVQEYEHDLYQKDLSDKEAILVALDKARAEALATDIIFKVQGGLWNWTCATPEMGVRVSLIREMSK